jgi:hypothetical protein
VSDEEFRAWLFAPLSLAELLRIEFDAVADVDGPTEEEVADAAREAMAREARLDQLVRRSINSTVRRMLTRPAEHVSRPMVDVEGWPTVRQPGGSPRGGLPSTTAMIRSLAS